MTEASPLLGLPYIQPAQAQKHVTHNEAIRRLDLVTQLSVRSATTAAPPASVAEGDRFILPAGATAPWSAPAGQIACRDGGAWSFLVPNAGWLVWVADEARLVVWTGSAWATALGAFDMIGVNATADAGNRLAVSSPASLFNHAGAGHQIKVNKAAPADTGSLLFQTDWSGRAEMGLAGSDDFAIKVSADGSTFAEALRVDRTSGKVSFPQGVAGLDTAELFANGTCAAGSDNFPLGLDLDMVQAPDLPAAMFHAGHGGVTLESAALMPVDPRRVYRLSLALRQQAVSGDWSVFAQAERHGQTVGLRAYDAAGNLIEARHHMRYRHAGTDSLTVLAAPLAPGDTAVSVASATGWNESSAADYDRGVTVFAYKDARGRLHDRYSRLVEYDLFDLGGVNKGSGVITLNRPWPAALGNPDDASGIWPAGTPIANSASGESHKAALCQTHVPGAVNQWFRLTNWIGGIDRSGTNAAGSFPPGTAQVRVIWRPNETNVPGGAGGFPDTGSDQRVWFAGVSLMAEHHATLGDAGGVPQAKVLSLDAGAGTVSLLNATLRVEEI